MTQPIQELPNAKYGENKQFEQMQQEVPLPEFAAPPTGESVQPPVAAEQAQRQPVLPPLSPFIGPTTRPDEPVTAGSPSGPGPNSLSLGALSPQANGARSLSDSIQDYAAQDTTETLARIAWAFTDWNA